MVAPLVHEALPLLPYPHAADRVLGDYREAVGGDHLGDAVVDLRIDMVGAPREEDDVAALPPRPVYDELSLLHDVALVAVKLLIGLHHRTVDVALPEPLVRERGPEPLCHALLVVDGEERLHEFNAFLPYDVHVGADVLRAGGDDRAVVGVVEVDELVVPVHDDAGIENLPHALLNEVHDMPVRELRRVAQGVRGHCRHAGVIERRR